MCSASGSRAGREASKKLKGYPSYGGRRKDSAGFGLYSVLNHPQCKSADISDSERMRRFLAIYDRLSDVLNRSLCFYSSRLTLFSRNIGSGIVMLLDLSVLQILLDWGCLCIVCVCLT